MKIYVVTQGGYSDYRIITATTDEEIANKIAKKFNEDYDETHIKIFDDAEFYLKPIYFVRFDRKGDVTEIKNVSNSIYDYETINRCGFDIHSGVFVSVQADNEEHAIKIASEKRAEFLARKAGMA